MNFYKSVSIPLNNVVLTLIIFLFLISSSVKAEKTESNFIGINTAENTITVKLVNADISDIAQMLSKGAGIKVLLDKHISRKITQTFENVPLELGIKKLLGPDINSAFIFFKQEHPSGKVSYRLDMVKIFNTGNMLSADFEVFDKNTHKGNKTSMSSVAGNSGTDTALYRRMPGTPGAIEHEIRMARKNLDMIHMKKKIENDFINRKIMELKIKLSQNPSPAERALLTKKLAQAEHELSEIRHLNIRIIMDEERNLRELTAARARIESQRKFSERQRQSQSRRP